MASQTNPIRRKKTSSKVQGVKALIMASSIAITLGGWGVLATGQIKDAQASALPAQVSTTNSVTQTSTSTNSQTTIRPSTATAPVAIARTRSSR